MGSGAFAPTVTIPAKVNDYTVVALGKYAFANCSDVAKVVLPEGIMAIAANVFENATNMKTMMLPASIQTIGNEAFKGCSQLKQIINMNPTPISLSPVEARGMSKSGTRSAVASQFEGISSDCILYVPAASKTLYDSDPQWSGSFKEIVGIAGMGDANHDGRISQKDAVDVIDYLLTNAPDKILLGVSDMNGDDAITVTDLVKIIEASQGHAGSREQK